MLADNRKIDNLGRICIPKEIRTELNIDVTDQLEVICGDQEIKIRKKEIACVFCNSKEDLIEIRGRHICQTCINKLNNSSIQKYKGKGEQTIVRIV